MNARRVVVTGIGALTPIGNNLQDYWSSLLKGVSGADYITHFNPTNFKTNFACEVKDFEVTDFIKSSALGSGNETVVRSPKRNRK